MSVISKIHSGIREGSNIFRTQWIGLQTDDTGSPLELPTASDQSVHVMGVFNGCTLTIQGSDEDAPTAGGWATMHDAFGDLLQFTAKGILPIAENVRHMRCVLTGGDGSTSVDVLVISRST